MSDDVTDGESGAENEEEAPKKGGLKKKLLLFGLPVVILLLGGAGAMMLLGGGGDEGESHASAAGEHGEAADDGHGGGDASHGVATAGGEYVFYELPELLVNINSEDGETKYLKLKLVLELEDEALIETLDARLPRVVDQYQTFLRELRVEDLSGSAGMYRLRHELLRRVNLAVAPAQVNNVLVDEILFR
ncbi:MULTISPECIES: flagellar basal body-associated FliL family protein [Euryhalocaulis]|uniref:flagellar basal body-associated FliL family protein n=1 Tax=Euryhalocaulis TaxID=1712422 RepID=UPI0003B69A48|nr:MULTISPECIES: flagellar basal body-associated FliL family protein [Euryhalocaulis]MBA4802360.1 flagellar basal body-associated FliL family protein [Euryhalocaulis sp.]